MGRVGSSRILHLSGWVPSILIPRKSRSIVLSNDVSLVYSFKLQIFIKLLPGVCHVLGREEKVVTKAEHLLL